MRIKTPNVVNCPNCSRQLDIEAEIITDGICTDLYSCIKNSTSSKQCPILYSHLLINDRDNPYCGYLLDRLIYINKYQVHINYLNDVVTISRQNIAPVNFSCFDFNYSDKQAIEEKVKTLLIFK